MILRGALALACLAGLSSPAGAVVGGAPPARAEVGRHVVLIVGSRGNSCTGTAIGPDLVLTAAHCVPAGADYKLVAFDADRRPTLRDIAEVARHPLFDRDAFRRHRATADVALLKLAAPAPALVPAALAGARRIEAGERFILAGFGLAVAGDERSGGTLRAATLTATGRPGTLQLRLVDPQGNGVRAGLGACTGDSGAPAFAAEGARGRLAIVGVVSWSTGPGNAAGCGGLTGITPLARYRDWIVETARKLNSALSP